jgi:hypothetical protein
MFDHSGLIIRQCCHRFRLVTPKSTMVNIDLIFTRQIHTYIESHRQSSNASKR